MLWTELPPAFTLSSVSLCNTGHQVDFVLYQEIIPFVCSIACQVHQEDKEWGIANGSYYLIGLSIMCKMSN